MKFNEAMKDLHDSLGETESPQSKAPKPADEAANMAMLEAMIRDSDFKGKR